MKRIILALCIIASLLVFTGCQEESTKSVKSDPFLGGTTGITIEFAEGSPPEEVYDGGDNSFDISLVLENKGEHDVQPEDIVIKISGLYPESFEVSEGDLTKHPEEDVLATEKDSEEGIIEGPPVYVSFDGFNYADELKGNNMFPVRADVCYKYETEAVANLCIRENNIDTTEEGVCEVQGTKKVYNSGAPVQISEFKEVPMSPNKVRFQFYIKHMGTGEIFKKDTTCSKEINNDEDKVWVEVESEIGSGLRCTGLSEGTDTTGFTRLYSDKKLITCTQEVTTSSDYEMPVNINVVYDYEQDKSADILVKHAAS